MHSLSLYFSKFKLLVAVHIPMLSPLMQPNLSIPGSVHDLPFLSMGVSSMVYEVSKMAVIKAPCGTDESLHQLAVERAIYERLGSHPYVTKVLSI